MSANLQLVFSRDKGHRTLTITDPKEGLTKEQVYAAMESLVNRQVILSSSKPVEGVKNAYLSEVTITELAA